jgi:hypothetical protein
MLKFEEPYHMQSGAMLVEARSLWTSVWKSISEGEETWSLENKVFQMGIVPVAAVVASMRTSRTSPTYEYTLTGTYIVPHVGEDIEAFMVKLHVLEDEDTGEKVIYVATLFQGENIKLIVDYFQRLASSGEVH